MASVGVSMEHQGLSIGHHDNMVSDGKPLVHRFSMEHHGCDPVHHGTPRGFHRAGWFFHGSPWGIDGTWDSMGLSIAMLYPCCPVSMQIKTCILQSCTYSFNFKYDFRVDLPVYCSSTSSLLVNSISMSLELKWEGKELRNKLNRLRNKRVNPVLMSMEWKAWEMLYKPWYKKEYKVEEWLNIGKRINWICKTTHGNSTVWWHNW